MGYGTAQIAQPVWTSSDASTRGAIHGSHDCDLAIIGGGLVGLTAAEFAGRHGLRVCLIEAAGIGSCASGRNAAGVAPIWGAQTPDGAVAEIGAERAALLNAALAASATVLIERSKTLPIDCGAVEGGFLALAARQETVASLPGLAEQWKRAGAEVAVLGHSLAHHVDSPRYVGGLLFAAGGTLNPLAYVRGLARDCESLGVRIFEHSPVAGITRQPGGRWSVKSSGGRLNAATVVVAVNGGSGLAFELDRLGWRIDCQLLGSAPLTQTQRSALPRAPTFADLDDASVFGGTVASDGRFVTTVLPGPGLLSLSEAGEAVSGKIARAFPGIEQPDWTGIDAAHILITPKKLPQLVELGPRLFAGQGCNGYGLCAGTLLGEDLARLALQRDDMPHRFPLEKPRVYRLARLIPALIRQVMPLARRLT
jgi:glycine/D-amino acid oxidase-like deaminating enzyme